MVTPVFVRVYVATGLSLQVERVVFVTPIDGFDVGFAVGRDEGFVVGLPEGGAGLTDGFDVGFIVGLADALFVGGLVGLLVGK